MWGNDVHGDCVTAEEAFAKACNNPEIFISDDEVIAWATSHGVLKGAYLTQVMTWMQNDGFAGGPVTYDDGNYFSVNWANAGTLQSAISSQGPSRSASRRTRSRTLGARQAVNRGGSARGFTPTPTRITALRSAATDPSLGWHNSLASRFPSGVDGTQPGYALFTWNSIGIIDVPSMTAVTHEAWIRSPPP